MTKKQFITPCTKENETFGEEDIKDSLQEQIKALKSIIDELEVNAAAIPKVYHIQLKPIHMYQRELLAKLRSARVKAVKLHTANHYTDYDITKWDNPVDGLDYAIGLITGEVK